MDFTRRIQFFFFVAVFLLWAAVLPSQEADSETPLVSEASLPVELEAQAVSEEPPVLEELLLDGRTSPRLHLYDGEETALLSSSSSRSLATMADNSVTHRIYDGAYRLKSKLTWQEAEVPAPNPTGGAEGNGSLLEPPRLISQEDYYYHGDSPSYQRIVLTNFQEKSRTESFFSTEGLLTREEISRFVPEDAAGEHNTSDDKKESKQGATAKADDNDVEEEVVVEVTDLPLDPWKDFPQLTLTKKIEYQYNEEMALVEKVTTHLEGEESFSERIVYHQPGNIYGGYDQFEDDKLLVSRKYQDKSHYMETRYMDGMKIEAQYNGARLVSEIMYLDGKELRRTEY